MNNKNKTILNTLNPQSPVPNPQRIAKFLADSGAASRREAERLIESGAVTVNGVKITSPVFFVDGTEEIKVKEKGIRKKEKARVYVFHKPINTMVTTKDPQGRKTIYDVLKQSQVPNPRSLKYVGRLDFKTTGLLLMTNDGELARKLTLPSSNIERVYIAECSMFKVQSSNIDKILKPVRAGIVVDGVKYRPMKIKDTRTQGRKGTMALKITVTEGKKNEIRIVLAAVGLPVVRLHRVSYGSVELGNLSVGQITELTQKKIDALMKSL